ncbi:porin [Paraburkholderia strydomiana]|uniref:porin n=1 Tax=Paraburkholderia strydomiana TaxID=1245417 RepID=UPI00286600F5|nr:porin [Paraburkholderia strydomiana]MDR7009637.1 putative porin [Paraburkholderia strydomiana]
MPARNDRFPSRHIDRLVSAFRPFRFETPRLCTARVAVKVAASLALGTSAHPGWAADTFLSDYFVGVPYATSAAYTPGLTLYGVVDEAIGYMKGGQTSFVQQSSGEWTSKFGLYGVEDLGGQYTVRFALENGFNAANGQLGTANTIFNREAWVAIGSRGTGELKFGLQDDVGVPLFVDVFGQVGSVSAVAYLTAWTYDLGPGASYQPSRLSNAVSYSTPWFGPLNAQLAISLAGAGTAAPTVTTRSIALNYYDGHLLGTLAYVGNYGLNALTTSSYVRTDNFAAGVLYDAKNYVLSAGYSFLAPRLAGDRVASLYTAGALYRYQQRNDFRAELAYRTVGGYSDRSLGVTLGYDYNLSKRTAVYVRGSVIRNTGSVSGYGRYLGMQPTVNNINNSYVGENGVTENYQAPHVVLVGLYHKF